MSTQHNFQPNGKLYKTFCFHVKNVSMAIGMIEILFICVLLIGVPEISLRLCTCTKNNMTFNDTGTSRFNEIITTITPVTISKKQKRNSNDTITNVITSTTRDVNIVTTTDTYNILENNTKSNLRDCFISENPIEKKILAFSLCKIDVIWLFLALSHIVYANLFIYGIKSTKPKTMIPYIISKTIFICILMSSIVLSIVILIKDHSTANVPYSSISVNKFIFIALVIALVAILYTQMVNCFTYHFVKRSFETGYSISAARPFAQTSGSISEHHRNSRDKSPFDINIDQGNRIELTPRNQEQSLDDNVIAKRNHTSSHNQIPKVLPPLRHTFRPNTANRLPEK
uniref:Uncharacterized protein n=1 Tax=Strongyloides venezuelensis TaxID=75913 RepID=A0A0K0FIE9_STRVS